MLQIWILSTYILSFLLNFGRRKKQCKDNFYGNKIKDLSAHHTQVCNTKEDKVLVHTPEICIRSHAQWPDKKVAAYTKPLFNASQID